MRHDGFIRLCRSQVLLLLLRKKSLGLLQARWHGVRLLQQCLLPVLRQPQFAMTCGCVCAGAPVACLHRSAASLSTMHIASLARRGALKHAQQGCTGMHAAFAMRCVGASPKEVCRCAGWRLAVLPLIRLDYYSLQWLQGTEGGAKAAAHGFLGAPTAIAADVALAKAGACADAARLAACYLVINPACKHHVPASMGAQQRVLWLCMPSQASVWESEMVAMRHGLDGPRCCQGSTRVRPGSPQRLAAPCMPNRWGPGSCSAMSQCLGCPPWNSGVDSPAVVMRYMTL